MSLWQEQVRHVQAGQRRPVRLAQSEQGQSDRRLSQKGWPEPDPRGLCSIREGFVLGVA